MIDIKLYCVVSDEAVKAAGGNRGKMGVRLLRSSLIQAYQTLLSDGRIGLPSGTYMNMRQRYNDYCCQYSDFKRLGQRPEDWLNENIMAFIKSGEVYYTAKAKGLKAALLAKLSSPYV